MHSTYTPQILTEENAHMNSSENPTKPFGMEYLEPMSNDDEVLASVYGAQQCLPGQTYHLQSGTVTNDLICND